MSIKFKLVRDALWQWVNDVTELTVIWADPNAPRPDTPYLMLRIDNITSPGIDYLTPPDEDGMAALLGDRQFNLEINFYGNDGFDVMEKLRTSLFSFDIQNLLLDAGVCFVDRMTQNNLTELLDTRYEHRFMAEYMFRISNQGVDGLDKFDVGFIETLNTTGKLRNEEGDVVTEDEINTEDE